MIKKTIAPLLTVATLTSTAYADLADVKARGVLRHVGVPYANFVTGAGDGLSVELMQRFAQHLGVEYRHVKASWKTVIPSITGMQVKSDGDDVQVYGQHPVTGDVIANGLTQIAWREKVVNYSTPTFPTQVWLVTKSEQPLLPILPTNSIEQDILTVKSKLIGKSVLGKENTCLEPALYNIKATGATPILFNGSVNDLAPALLFNEADTLLLDVADALVAFEKWPGKIKVIGPISEQQNMGVAFPKTSPELLSEFNKFFDKVYMDGSYSELVKKYYPGVFEYYPEFFNRQL